MYNNRTIFSKYLYLKFKQIFTRWRCSTIFKFLFTTTDIYLDLKVLVSFFVFQEHEGSYETEIVADAGSSSRGFSSAFAPFQPQRELRIITAAYPVATGVKPQPPIGIRRTYGCTCKRMRISVRTGVSVSARTHLRTRTWRMYVLEGMKTARDVTDVQFSRLDSTRAH